MRQRRRGGSKQRLLRRCGLWAEDRRKLPDCCSEAGCCSRQVLRRRTHWSVSFRFYFPVLYSGHYPRAMQHLCISSIILEIISNIVLSSFRFILIHFILVWDVSASENVSDNRHKFVHFGVLLSFCCLFPLLWLYISTPNLATTLQFLSFSKRFFRAQKKRPYFLCMNAFQNDIFFIFICLFLIIFCGSTGEWIEDEFDQIRSYQWRTSYSKIKHLFSSFVLFVRVYYYQWLIAQTIPATADVTPIAKAAAVRKVIIFFSSFICFDLLCLCFNHSFEKNQIVPTVTVA